MAYKNFMPKISHKLIAIPLLVIFFTLIIIYILVQKQSSNKIIPVPVQITIFGEIEISPTTNMSGTQQSRMTESEARTIAEKSCIKGGKALSPGYYNENSNTWWYDANLNATKPGCKPSCVVSEKSKTAEINWRCTGLMQN